MTRATTASSIDIARIQRTRPVVMPWRASVVDFSIGCGAGDPSLMILSQSRTRTLVFGHCDGVCRFATLHYFGITFGLPPGAPGGGTTDIDSGACAGGLMLMP